MNMKKIIILALVCLLSNCSFIKIENKKEQIEPIAEKVDTIYTDQCKFYNNSILLKFKKRPFPSMPIEAIYTYSPKGAKLDDCSFKLRDFYIHAMVREVELPIAYQSFTFVSDLDTMHLRMRMPNSDIYIEGIPFKKGRYKISVYIPERLSKEEVLKEYRRERNGTYCNKIFSDSTYLETILGKEYLIIPFEERMLRIDDKPNELWFD